MKISHNHLIIIIAAFIANGWFVLPARSQCWTEQTSASQANLTAIAFSDSRHGIAVGTKMLRTTNGGATWSQSVLPNFFTDVFMFDSLYAIAIESSGDIYHTTDGGNSWSLKKNLPNLGAKFSFWDRNRGLFLANGQISRTTDGGLTWDSRIGASVLTSLACTDTACAVAVGGTYLIGRTTNGGNSWDWLNNPTTDTLVFVSFVNANMGIIITRNKNSKTLLRTTDGGAHWSARSIQNGTYNMFSFLDASRWIGLYNNQLLATQDAALSFTTQALPFEGYETNDLTYLPNGNILLLQYSSALARSRVIALTKNNCFAIATPVAPANGTQNVSLLHSGATPNAIALQWIKPHTLVTATARVQYSTDSLFPPGNTIEFAALQYSGSDTSSVIISRLGSLTRYYWRVAFQYIDGATQAWSPSSAFTTAGGSIWGTVFRDFNKNGIFDGGESGLSGCAVQLGGKKSGTLVSDSAGGFSFLGLDSGVYRVSYVPNLPWQSSSINDTVSALLPFNGTVSGIEFGEFFPWNSITGNLFHDLNENGIKDTSDQGLSGWSVRLLTPTRRTFSITDSLGTYMFPDIESERCDVSLVPVPRWEKIAPRHTEGYSIEFQGTNTHISSQNFAVQPIPSRIKIAMGCHDDSYNNTTVVRWGVRPGATTGIWFYENTTASLIDYSEGEDELPPLLDSVFDVRFISPPGSHFLFGLGSWIDIRPYLSSSQVDTFYLYFITGPRAGGSYPITFTWSKEAVRELFAGPVFLQDSSGNTYDMKNLDSIVISDGDVKNLFLIASSPLLPTNGVPHQGAPVPLAYSLEQNYPNPFNPSTELKYTIRDLSHITITVFDLLGRELTTLVKGMKPPGSYTVAWDASRYPSGIYFCRLLAEDRSGTSYSFVKKMLLVK